MYRYLDPNGPTRHPSRDEVICRASTDGVVTALVLDANVCLELAAVGRTSSVSDSSAQALRFVQQVAESGVDVVPGFGLAELAFQRVGWKLERDRLESLERAISSALDSALVRNDQPEPSVVSDETDFVNVSMFEPLVPLLQVFYASLLKVSCLAATGLDRARAVRNVEAYLDWAADEFGCIAALPLQAAVAIFGGDSHARKLIGAGSAKSTQQAVWSGAWDVFYLHQLYNLALIEIEGLPQHPIFVTQDRACYEIFTKSRLQGAIRLELERLPQIVSISSDYPHYRGREDDLAAIFKDTALSRIDGLVAGTRMTQAHLDGAIVELEGAV